MTQVLYTVLELSRGSVWKTHPGLPPYLVATPGDPWPAGGSAWVVFTDTAGAELARIDADCVDADAIAFVAGPDEVDPIPSGANFEIFVDTDDGPRKIRYGVVVRREVEYFDAPARQQQAAALQFSDTFPTLGLRSNWIKLVGNPKPFANSPLPHGVGLDQVLLGEAKGAMRWDQELNSDTARMKFRFYSKHNTFLGGDFAHLTAIFAADHRLSTGLAVRLSNSEATGGGALRLCTINGGPLNPQYVTGAQPIPLTDNADYTLYYDSSVDELHVYQGSDTEPFASWGDELHSQPHGPGYRHYGVSWHNSNATDGLRLTYIAAKDDV